MEAELPQPRSMGKEASYADGKAGNATGTAAVDYDDEDWTLVDLPHDFALFQPVRAEDNIAQGFRRRGVVVLGLFAPTEELVSAFAVAAAFPCVKGFAVGRTIFFDAARAWMQGALDDEGAVQMMAERFSTLVEAWRQARRRLEKAA